MASFIFVVAVVDDSIRMIEKINGHEKALVCWLGFDAQQQLSGTTCQRKPRICFKPNSKSESGSAGRARWRRGPACRPTYVGLGRILMYVSTCELQPLSISTFDFVSLHVAAVLANPL